MRTKEMVGAILALTIFLGLASIALADVPGTPFQVGGHVYLDATPVSGAAVTVTNQVTGESLTTTTESTGAYVVSLSNLPGGHSAGDTIQVTATYNGQTGTSSAPRSENLDDAQIIDVTIVAQAVQIKAEAGGALPTSILVGETFTVLITEDGSPVDAGTNVVFRLPYDTGDPVTVSTDDDGKVNYTPLNTGTLGIRVLDGTVTVAEETVEVIPTGIQTLTVTADPTSVIVDSPTDVLFTVETTEGSAVEGATVTLSGAGVSNVSTTDGSGTATISVTATSIGTIDVIATKTGYVGATTTIAVDGSGSSGNNTTPVIDECVNVTGNFTGDVYVKALGNVTEVSGGSTFGLGSGVPLIGATVTATLGDDEWVRIGMDYTDVELGGVDEASIEIYKFDVTIAEWELVRTQTYCIDSGRDMAANYIWVEVDELSTFALVGTKTAAPSRRGGSGGGSGGTYPPGWGTTTTTAAVTATAAPGATPGVTPPEEAVTTPTKPAVVEETAPEEAEETPTKKKTPGFTAVFAIAGLLAIAYAMMRRRD